jgi:hypothetical protein
MKISIGETIMISNNIDWGPNFWEMSFEEGVVEGGSSGAPLINENGLLIGQHSGRWGPNLLTCINPNAPAFSGRFDVSWGRDINGDFLPGRNATNSLAPWLDPNNTNAMTTNTIPIPTISGPDYLCSTNTFTLQNVPAGSTVNWIAEPGSLFSNNPPSGSGTSAPLSPISSFASGQATVTFTIETPCGEMEVKKSFWVGTPSFTSSTVDGNPYIIGSCHGVCPGFHEAEVTIGGLTNAMPPDVNWQLSGGPVSWSWDHFTSRITFEVQPMTSFPFSFNGTATNPCGSTPFTFCFISGPNCPMGSYALSPNPADGEVVVTNQAATEEDTDQAVEILIISQSFETVYSMTAKGKKIRVPTGQLPNGQYIIQISDKNGVYRKHLIIRH